MRRLMLGSIVFAGVLIGGAAVAIMLGLSGLEIRIHRQAAPRTTEMAMPVTPGPTTTNQAAVENATLEIGPVPLAVAGNIAGELTLAGVSVRVNLRGGGRPEAVIIVGPHPRATIEGVAAMLKRRSRTVTYVIRRTE